MTKDKLKRWIGDWMTTGVGQNISIIQYGPETFTELFEKIQKVKDYFTVGQGSVTEINKEKFPQEILDDTELQKIFETADKMVDYLQKILENFKERKNLNETEVQKIYSELMQKTKKLRELLNEGVDEPEKLSVIEQKINEWKNTETEKVKIDRR